MKFSFLQHAFLSILLSVFCLANVAKAGLLDAEAYNSNSANSMYWTNNDLGLDIMRLSYSDVLNPTGQQASKNDVDNWLALNQEWQWSNESQLKEVYGWFDTDSGVINSNGWTAKQGLGSSLFFELMGVANIHANYKNGRLDSKATWFMHSDPSVSNIPDFHGIAQVADYCDSQSECYIGSSLTYSDGWHNASYVYTGNVFNLEHAYYQYANAALLVRKVNVPEPSSIAIFALSFLALTTRKSKKLKHFKGKYNEL